MTETSPEAPGVVFGLDGDRPVCAVRVDGLERFEGIECRFEFGVFSFPTNALLAGCVTLETDEPAFVHQLFDLASEQDVAFLRTVGEQNKLVLALIDEADRSIEADLAVDGANLATFVDQGVAYAKGLERVDAGEAERQFTEMYDVSMARERNVRVAWESIVAALQPAKPPAPAPAPQPVRVRSGRGFYWFARTLQIVSGIPIVGAWAVILIGPAILVGICMLFGLRKLPAAESDLFSLIFGLGFAIWGGWLDARGIVRINLPYIPVPVWALGIVMALGALLSLVFG